MVCRMLAGRFRECAFCPISGKFTCLLQDMELIFSVGWDVWFGVTLLVWLWEGCDAICSTEGSRCE
jgi:hypothetical protein